MGNKNNRYKQTKSESEISEHEWIYTKPKPAAAKKDVPTKSAAKVDPPKKTSCCKKSVPQKSAAKPVKDTKEKEKEIIKKRKKTCERNLKKIMDDPVKHEKFLKSNELEKLLMVFPKENWIYDYLFENSNCSLKYIEKYIKKNSNLDQIDYWYYISGNPSITIEFIEKYKDYVYWDYVSENKNIKLEDIISHPELPWDYDGLSINPNMRMSYVLNNLNKDWDWYYLAKNSGILIEDFFEHQELPWTFEDLSENPNLRVKHLLHYRKKKWNWNEVTKNSGITFEDIINYPKLKWNFEAFCHNDNFSYKNVIEHPELFSKDHMTNDYTSPVDELFQATGEINCEDFIENKNLTLQFIIDHPSDEWDWELISSHSNITQNDIESHPELPWDYTQISANPNITFEFIRKHIDKNWDFGNISYNEFAHYFDDNPCVCYL